VGLELVPEDVEAPHAPILSEMIAAALTALALSLPHHADIVPGRSFAGLRLGATGAQVTAAWGRVHGRCRDCAKPTWYFTYHHFAPQGAGVSFRHGAVDSFFTLWAPPGWRTDRGLKIGDPEPRVTQLYGALPRVECGTYSALVLRRGQTATQFYLYRDHVWGFGLSLAGAPPCH
jgi:hypothetical protein